MNKERTLKCDHCENAGKCELEPKFRLTSDLLKIGRSYSEIFENVFGGEVPDCDFVCNCELCRKGKRLKEKIIHEFAEFLEIDPTDIKICPSALPSPLPGLLPNLIGLEIQISDKAIRSLEKRCYYEVFRRGFG